MELIKREDAIREMFRFKGYIGFDEDMLYRIEYALNQIPTIDAVPVVHGEWVEENRRPRSTQFVCSVCHRTAYDPQPTRDPKWVKRCRYAYCPNCGASMDGGRKA